MVVGQAFQVDVRVDQAGQSLTAKSNDLGPTPRGQTRAFADRQDPPARPGRHLRFAPGEENGSLRAHRP
jgi:hypothetical protein